MDTERLAACVDDVRDDLRPDSLDLFGGWVVLFDDCYVIVERPQVPDLFANMASDVTLAVPETSGLFACVTSEQAIAEQNAEWLSAERERPCNGNGCRWVGTFNDGWGFGQ
jgi:hypothetical protein